MPNNPRASDWLGELEAAHQDAANAAARAWEAHNGPELRQAIRDEAALKRAIEIMRRRSPNDQAERP